MNSNKMNHPLGQNDCQGTCGQVEGTVGTFLGAVEQPGSSVARSGFQPNDPIKDQEVFFSYRISLCGCLLSRFQMKTLKAPSASWGPTC